ncbi:MAG: gluconate 2-dehydrogenase subunit 3 family protein, partial [Candidatus Acidiferrales bacterium]
MKWTRREMLETGIMGPIALGVSGLIKISRPLNETALSDAQALSSEERDLLRAVMDEIVPGGDGMPAASEVGGVDYLAQLMENNKDATDRLFSGLAVVKRISRVQFQSSFRSLNESQRRDVLSAFETQDRHSFDSVRDYV